MCVLVTSKDIFLLHARMNYRAKNGMQHAAIAANKKNILIHTLKTLPIPTSCSEFEYVSDTSCWEN